ncbi:MAG: ATP-binding protein [Pseudobdellovibrio sp.]
MSTFFYLKYRKQPSNYPTINKLTEFFAGTPIDAIVNRYMKQGQGHNEILQIKNENALIQNRKELIKEHGLDGGQDKDINLENLIDYNLLAYRKETQNKITIHRQFTKVPNVHGLESQLEIVINAVLAYSAHVIKNKGDVWISTELLPEQENTERFVQISIQDNGPGLTPEEADQLFQIGSYSRTVGVELGKTLKTAYAIIKKNHGDLTIHSDESKGTEFKIIVPVAP